jgi:hypothetical protein
MLALTVVSLYRLRTTLGIFKPADEEPYGSLNPKWVLLSYILTCLLDI